MKLQTIFIGNLFAYFMPYLLNVHSFFLIATQVVNLTIAVLSGYYLIKKRRKEANRKNQKNE